MFNWRVLVGLCIAVSCLYHGLCQKHQEQRRCFLDPSAHIADRAGSVQCYLLINKDTRAYRMLRLARVKLGYQSKQAQAIQSESRKKANVKKQTAKKKEKKCWKNSKLQDKKREVNSTRIKVENFKIKWLITSQLE